MSADNFAYVIPVDYLIHTPDNPFCPIDPSCPCHEDPILIAEVTQYVANGEMTPEEAADFVQGKML